MKKRPLSCNPELATRNPKLVIGEVFGGITYSAVAKLYKRFANNLKEDRKLRKKLIGIEREMSNVKV